MPDSPKISGSKESLESHALRRAIEHFDACLADISLAEAALQNLRSQCGSHLRLNSEDIKNFSPDVGKESWTNPPSFEDDWALSDSNNLRSETKKLHGLLYPIAELLTPTEIIHNIQFNGRVFLQYRSVAESFVETCTLWMSKEARSSQWVESVIAIIDEAVTTLFEYATVYSQCRESIEGGARIIPLRRSQKTKK